MALRYRKLTPRLITVVAMAALWACGQRGPLTLPDDAADTAPSVAGQDPPSSDEQEEDN